MVDSIAWFTHDLGTAVEGQDKEMKRKGVRGMDGSKVKKGHALRRKGGEEREEGEEGEEREKRKERDYREKRRRSERIQKNKKKRNAMQCNEKLFKILEIEILTFLHL